MVLGFRWLGIARTRVRCESVLGIKWCVLKQQRYLDTVLTIGQVSLHVSTYRAYERTVSAIIGLLHMIPLTINPSHFNVEVAVRSGRYDITIETLHPPNFNHHHHHHHNTKLVTIVSCWPLHC